MSNQINDLLQVKVECLDSVVSIKQSELKRLYRLISEYELVIEKYKSELPEEGNQNNDSMIG